MKKFLSVFLALTIVIMPMNCKICNGIKDCSPKVVQKIKKGTLKAYTHGKILNTGDTPKYQLNRYNKTTDKSLVKIVKNIVKAVKLFFTAGVISQIGFNLYQNFDKIIKIAKDKTIFITEKIKVIIKILIFDDEKFEVKVEDKQLKVYVAKEESGSVQEKPKETPETDAVKELPVSIKDGSKGFPETNIDKEMPNSIDEEPETTSRTEAIQIPTETAQEELNETFEVDVNKEKPEGILRTDMSNKVPEKILKSYEDEIESFTEYLKEIPKTDVNKEVPEEITNFQRFLQLIASLCIAWVVVGGAILFAEVKGCFLKKHVTVRHDGLGCVIETYYTHYSVQDLKEFLGLVRH